jgi:hypothetical protein
MRPSASVSDFNANSDRAGTIIAVSMHRDMIIIEFEVEITGEVI